MKEAKARKLARKARKELEYWLAFYSNPIFSFLHVTPLAFLSSKEISEEIERIHSEIRRGLPLRQAIDEAFQRLVKAAEASALAWADDNGYEGHWDVAMYSYYDQLYKDC